MQRNDVLYLSVCISRVGQDSLACLVYLACRWEQTQWAKSQLIRSDSYLQILWYRICVFFVWIVVGFQWQSWHWGTRRKAWYTGSHFITIHHRWFCFCYILYFEPAPSSHVNILPLTWGYILSVICPMCRVFLVLLALLALMETEWVCFFFSFYWAWHYQH